MYTRVAYLERNKMEINISILKKKRKRKEKTEFLEFFNIDGKKKVTMRVTITVRN